MMKMKTYLAPGLLDLRLIVRAGSAWTTVDFTGGRSSGYGSCCARYSTADPVMQRLIENSPEFANGRIIIKEI